MEKDQLLKSVARVALAGLGMGIVAAADEAAKRDHSPKQRRNNVAGWALVGAICQGITEIYYSKKKEEQ